VIFSVPPSGASRARPARAIPNVSRFGTPTRPRPPLGAFGEPQRAVPPLGDFDPALLRKAQVQQTRTRTFTGLCEVGPETSPAPPISRRPVACRAALSLAGHRQVAERSTMLAREGETAGARLGLAREQVTGSWGQPRARKASAAARETGSADLPHTGHSAVFRVSHLAGSRQQRRCPAATPPYPLRRRRPLPTWFRCPA
jgi:hypothetical protein